MCTSAAYAPINTFGAHLAPWPVVSCECVYKCQMPNEHPFCSARFLPLLAAISAAFWGRARAFEAANQILNGNIVAEKWLTKYSSGMALAENVLNFRIVRRTVELVFISVPSGICNQTNRALAQMNLLFRLLLWPKGKFPFRRTPHSDSFPLRHFPCTKYEN